MVSVKQQLLVCLLFGSTIVFGVDMPSDKKVDVNSSSNVIEKKVASQPVQPQKAVEAKASEMKSIIVLVDVQEVINNTHVDQGFVEALINKQQEFQKELKAKGDEIQKKEANLKAKASALSADALKKLYEELDDLRVQANRLAERRQKELQQEEMNTRFNVFKTIQEYAQQLQTKLGVKVIVEKNSVLAYEKTADVTSELVKIIKDDLAKKEAAKKKKESAAKKEEAVAPKASKLAAAA